MKEKYDAVVIGAGPAGLLAAKAVAENGLNIALVDRKKKIPVLTRTCGQSLLPPNEYFFGNLFHYNERDRRFCFPNVGLSFPYSGPIKKLYDWYLVSPVMNSIRFSYPAGFTPSLPGMVKAPIALVYDKEVLLQDLLNQLSPYHVDVFEDMEFSDINWEGSEVVVTAGKTRFKSTYVIAADGTNSRVVEKLGFNHDRKHIANIYVQSFFIKGFKPQTDTEPILTGVGFVQDKPVYVFCLPRPEGDEWNVLFLTFEKELDIAKAAEHLMKNSRFARSFKDTEKVREFTAVEHIYSPIIKPFKNNVMVVGDAASCQELECLGAMISGWKGGLAVAAALKEFQLGVPPRAVAEYCDWWLNTYIKQYDYQGYLQVFGVAYMFPRQDIIDYIFGLFKEPFPPTFNPYTAVNVLGAAMQKVMPQILSERPDIAQVLLPRLHAFPSEILAKTLKEVEKK